MCGIAGIYHLGGTAVDIKKLKKITCTLAHRGPDDEGYYTEKGIGLGHRRLSILDTSEKGRQPMVSGNKKYVIAFNGCIYNFRELKKELQKKGVKFKSGTDTEVILEGIAHYGIDFVKRLNGMFAFALYDCKNESVYLIRDRYGMKQLYYYFDGKKFIFASEIKAILAYQGIKVKLNYNTLNEYFTFQNIFTFNTFFEGINLLPPANIIKIDKGTKNISHNSYWDYDFSNPDYGMTFDDAKEETQRLMVQAIKRQLVSDVPVGSYLSGGMDSGTITAIASQDIERMSTFTCGFDLSNVTGIEGNYDERRNAELMASYYRTEHYEQVINAGDIRWSLPKVVWHLEDLRLGMSYPNFYISRLASKFVKVCLQGTGGDELFGGYPWRYYRVFHSLSQNDFFENYYHFWQRLVNDENKKNLFNNNVLAKINTDEPKDIFTRVFTFNHKLRYDTPQDHIHNSLYFEIKTFLQGLCIVGDKLSMANGLEERYPFLDNDLVDFAQKIPAEYKLGNLAKKIKRINENELINNKRALSYQRYDDGKNILRKAMADFIPAKILSAKKQGFSSPEENWFRGENAEYVKEFLLNEKTVSAEFINRDFIVKTVDEHINKKINHRLLIWSFLNFEWWCRLFLN